ncbi:hypothetical protein OY671_008614, partial [Metschnikowia pulcherrima]
DIRCVDPALDPSERKPNWCYRGDPAVANRTPSIGRANTLKTWLNMWSLETSPCQGAPHLAKHDTPASVVQGSADTGVFPSDARKIFDFSGSKDKTIESIPGAHYFEDSLAERQNAADLTGKIKVVLEREGTSVTSESDDGGISNTAEERVAVRYDNNA